MSLFQMKLFDSPIPVKAIQSKALELSYDELLKAYKNEYASIHNWEANPYLIQVPKVEAITQMARQQVQRYSSSFRLRQDCDLISLLGKIAYSHFLNESDDKVFDDWHNALGKGNRGIFWECPGMALGLRTTGQTKNTFTYSKNKNASLITAQAFARVQLQHNGSAYVELLGFVERHHMAPHVRETGKHLSINLHTLQRHGVLQTPENLRQAFLNRDCQ